MILRGTPCCLCLYASADLRLLFLLCSKKIKINLNVPLKSVEQKDIEGLHRTIDEDRKMVIQAAIVRTMKARQTLKHALLMQEVIQQLSSRFKPKIPVIKVRSRHPLSFSVARRSLVEMHRHPNRERVSRTTIKREGRSALSSLNAVDRTCTQDTTA